MPTSTGSKSMVYEPMFEFKETEDVSRLAELGKAIAALNARVVTFSPGKHFSEQYISLITMAQNSAVVRQWNEAHNLIWEATFLVNRAVETTRSAGLKLGLVFSPLITFVLLILLDWLMGLLSRGLIVCSVLRVEYFPFLWTGAIGGTTILYWGLIKHTIDLDFDDQYKLWYVFKPLLGAVFAIVSVLIIQGGVVTLGAGSALDNKNKEFLYVIAFLAGFSERFFVQLIDKVLTALLGGDNPKRRPSAQSNSTLAPSGTVLPTGAASAPVASSATEPEHPGLP